MTLVHLTGAPRAFNRESSGIKDMDDVGFKIGMLFLWGFVIISPVVSLYVSMKIFEINCKYTKYVCRN